MRTTIRTVFLLSIALSVAAPARAEDRAFVQGFGGLRLGTTVVTNTAFGGVVGTELIPSIQIVGEAGRLSDVLPNTVGSLVALTPVGFRLSAFYAQGGVRLTTPNRSAIAPYVETSAGVARLRNEFGGLGSPVGDALTNFGLRLLDRTEPMTAVGGGVVLRGGSVVADLGYRYRRFYASDTIGVLFNGGRLDTNEVRVGIGVRF